MSITVGPSTSPLPRRPRAGWPGFTLVEILVAVGVLMVAFLGVITVYLVGYGDISESGRDTAAAVLAQSLVEGMRNQPAALLTGLDGVDTANATPCPANPPRINALCTNWVAQVQGTPPFPLVLPGGQGRIAVAAIPNAITLNRITITLTWTEPGRGGRQLTVVAGRSD